MIRLPHKGGKLFVERVRLELREVMVRSDEQSPAGASRGHSVGSSLDSRTPPAGNDQQRETRRLDRVEFVLERRFRYDPESA